MIAFARWTRRLLFALAASAAPTAGEISEVGRDDVRLSFAGGSGSIESTAELASAAFDPSRGRYLVVWAGYDGRKGGTPVPGLVARFVDARGEPDGPAVPLLAARFYSRPSLLYNAALDEFLLVFDSPHATGVDVVALRLDPATALPRGPAIDVQPLGQSGLDPAVAWNPAASEYLVVWSADTAARGTEIVAQRLAAADLAPLGETARAITRIGPDDDETYSAFAPRVVHNALAGEYLVAFLATPSAGPGQIADHFEVHVQRLVAATGDEVGADDALVSAMGPFDDAGSSAGACDLAFDPVRNRYLVVWEGHLNEPGVGLFETEIYSQALDGATAAEVGADDLRLTAVGGLGDPSQGARGATLRFDGGADRFVLTAAATFEGEAFDTEALVVEVDPVTGLPSDARLVSASGGATAPDRRVRGVAVAVADAGGRALAVWHGEDDDGGMIASELEVFVQPLVAGAIFVDDFEAGDLARWSAAQPKSGAVPAPPAGGG